MYKTVIKNASITMFSRVLGFCRDVLMARYLGASPQSEAFFIVFRLPNLFRRLLAEGVLSQSLLPSLVNAKEKRLFLQHVYAILWLLILSISFPFIFFPSKAISLVAPGLDPLGVTYQEACRLLPWVFPYLGCMASCGFYVVQLNLKNEYEVGSSLPLALNVSLIAGILSYTVTHDVWCLAFSVFISGLLQMFYCMYRVYRIQGVVLPRLGEKCEAFDSLLRQASDGFLAQVVNYLSSILILSLLSFLETGSISWIYYAERLVFLPIGLISVALANIVLTDLSQACSKGDNERVASILLKSSRWILLTSFPAMVGGYFLAEDIVAVLFRSERFLWSDVISCANVFKILALSLPFLMIVRVWNVVPFALSKPRHLLSISIRSAICSLLVSVFLLFPMKHLAICFGVMTGGIVNAYQLHQYIRKITKSDLIDVELAKSVLLASLTMACVLMLLSSIWPTSSNLTRSVIFGLLLLKSSVSVLSWLMALRLCKVKKSILIE